MATSNVIVSRSGTGFTIDVTACNLDPDLTIKDIFILHNGTPYNVLADYTKTTQTVLTYTGASLGTTTIEVRRKTTPLVIRPVNFGERMSSDLWNKELDRKTRWQEEADLNGVGVAFSGVVPSPRNDPYGVVWNGDTVFPPSRDVLYDKFELMAPLASPALTGNPTAPTQTPGNNSTRIATTAYVDAADALKANLASPALTGTPTAPTPAVNNNTTQLATTAFVRQSNRPAFFGFRTTNAGGTYNLNQYDVILESEDFDTSSALNLATGQFTVPTSLGGLYQLTGSVCVDYNTSGLAYLGLFVKVNGTLPVCFGVEGRAVASGHAIAVQGSKLYTLNAGDVVSLYIENYSSVPYRLRGDLGRAVSFSGMRVHS